MTRSRSTKRRHALVRFCLTASFCSCLAGCGLMFSVPMPDDPQSLLRAVETASDSVTLEIFEVRVPADDPNFANDLWTNVDEQVFDVELRRRLTHNGFRAGVLGGSLPDQLARHLNLQSEMPEVDAEQLITEQSADPRVARRVIQLNRLESKTLTASPLQENLVVMRPGRDGVAGDRYEQAQGVYLLQAAAAPGQRVAVELTPELQHGEVRNRRTGDADQGIFLIVPSREREVYEELKLATEISAGEILVLGCTTDAPGSLGRAFHAPRRNGPAEQKLILVRLLQVPGSEILADATLAPVR